MSSFMPADLRANEVIVRDFSNSNSGSQQQQQPTAPPAHTIPSQKAGEQQQEAQDSSIRPPTTTTTTTTTTTAPNPPEASPTSHHAKLPYTRFYSPTWTSQSLDPMPPPPPPPPPPPSQSQTSVPHPPRQHTHSSSRISSAEANRHLSAESGTSYGSRYSTVPYVERGFYNEGGGAMQLSRRASTGRRGESRHTSRESRYSTEWR